MKLQCDSAWTRKGVSLLWDAGALSTVGPTSEVVSLRRFIALARAWPDDLEVTGDALVVAGVEGCLDVLSAENGAKWLEEDLKQVILSFQEEYESQVALVLWLPSGRRRISMVRATEQYYWKRGAHRKSGTLPIGRCLWAGSEADAARIIVSSKPNPDPDGEAFVGLYHPRIS